jgi:RNA polymerase sigma-70 factor (ECF subfamily)
MVYARMRTLVATRPSDFDDLVQLAAIQAWRSLPSFEGRSGLTTWVYGVCYRVLLAQRRWYHRFSRRFAFPGELLELEDDGPQPAELVARRDRATRLRAVLGRMSEKYRAVVLLHDLEEFPVSEIAAIVGANERTVRSRLRDGRKQLRRLLATEPGFGEEKA